MTTIHLPNGGVALLRTTPLHRRKPYSRRPYSRPTDWLAQAGNSPVVWGRTQREAVAELMRVIGDTDGTVTNGRVTNAQPSLTLAATNGTVTDGNVVSLRY